MRTHTANLPANRAALLAAATLAAFCLIAAPLAGATEVGAAGPALDAASLLDASFEATGSAQAHAKVFNRVATGNVELGQLGLTGTVTETAAQPSFTRVVLDLSGVGRIESGTSGATAWETDSIQGARLLEGAERTLALRAAALEVGESWRDVFASAELAGPDTVDGRPCIKVVLTPAEGAPETWSLDAQTHLLRKTASIQETAMGKVRMEATFSDYREIDGVLEPFESTQSVLGQSIHMTYTSVRHNVDLPVDAFTPPPDVRALMNAPAPPPSPGAPTAAQGDTAPAPQQPAPSPKKQ